MDRKEADHIAYLARKLLKETSVQKKVSGRKLTRQKKILTRKIEGQMDRYLTDKEIELLGILINKLV